MRYLHYSLRTEKAYGYWMRRFVRFRQCAIRATWEREVTAFLTMLATVRRVSSSTHNQALSALLFLYREVLGVELPWLDGFSGPRPERIPVVLTREEVRALLRAWKSDATDRPPSVRHGHAADGGDALRVKDVDFDKRVIIVREAKGNKDRVVMLPIVHCGPARPVRRGARLLGGDRAAQRAGRRGAVRA